MSSAVQKELDKIKATKKNTQKAIIEKHVEQPENPFKSYPDGVRKIDEDIENQIFENTGNFGAFINDISQTTYGGPLTIRMNSQEQLDKWSSAANPTNILINAYAAPKGCPKLNASTTTNISNSMFTGNTNLTKIYFSENITEVGNYFLSGCTKFEQWQFQNLKKVGNYFGYNATVVPYPTLWYRNPFPLFNSLEEVGDYFLAGAGCETKLDLTTIKKAGNYFLNNSKISGIVYLPEDCDFTVTTRPLSGFYYPCTIYVPENWKLPIDNYTLSAYSNSSTAYTLGIKLVGPGAKTLAAALPNRTSSPYRKLVVEDLYEGNKIMMGGETNNNLLAYYDVDAKWYPYRVIYEQWWNEDKQEWIGMHHLLAEYVFISPTLGTNGLTSWGKKAWALDGFLINGDERWPEIWGQDYSHSPTDYTAFQWRDSTPTGKDQLTDGIYFNYASSGDFKEISSSQWMSYNGMAPNALILNGIGSRTTNTPNASQSYQGTNYFVGNFTKDTKCSRKNSDPDSFWPESDWLDFNNFLSAKRTGIAASGSNATNATRIGRDRFGNAREYWLMDSYSDSTKYYVTTSGQISTKAITQTSYWRPYVIN